MVDLRLEVLKLALRVI